MLMISFLRLLSLCLILGSVAAQYSYYGLSKTLTLVNPALANLNFDLKFSKVDIPSLAMSLTMGSKSIEIFFFPRPSEICIDDSVLGTLRVTIEQGTYDSVSISSTSLSINGNLAQFSSTILTCANSNKLKATTFSEPIGQIKMLSSDAAQLSSELSGFLVLADQSCITKPTTDCTLCLNGYHLANTPAVCKPLPYGCLKAGSNGLCESCRDGFDFDATSSRCHSGKEFVRSIGTKALVSSNSLTNDPTITLAAPLTDWTVQFYLMVQPSHKSQGSVTHLFMTLSQAGQAIQLYLDNQYSLALPKNQLSMYFKQGAMQSGPRSFQKGEWILVSMYNTASQYNLLIMKHGSSSVGKTNTINLLQAVLKLNSNDLTIYLKQLIIWKQSFTGSPDISTHTCRQATLSLLSFAHPASFTPHALYKFEVDTIQATTVLPDSTSTLPSIGNVFLPGGTTYSDLINTYQPISNLDDNFFLEGVSGFPTCMECSPNCSSCSDIYTCTQCSAGVLDNGVCLSDALTPLVGTAESTSFSYPPSFRAINTHLNVELFQDPSTQRFHSDSYFIEYPDGSTQSVTGIDSFKIPKYRKTGVTQFNAILKVKYTLGESVHITALKTATVNQVYTQAEAIKDQIQSSILPVSNQSECGCSAHASCSTITWKCTCHSGFSGTLCQFTESGLSNYQSQVTQEVGAIQANLGSLSALGALRELEYISRESEALTSSTADSILTIADSLLTSGSSQTEIALSLQIYSHISEAAGRSSQINLTSGTQAGVKKVLSLLLPSATTLTLTSSKITLKIQPYDRTTQNTISLSSSSVSLPSGLSAQETDAKIAMIAYIEPLFERKASHRFLPATQVLSLQLYENGFLKSVQGLVQPIQLSFGLSSTNKFVQERVIEILNSNLPASSLNCSFYKDAEQLMSTEGCSFTALSNTTLKCSCSHMADFMGFISTQLQSDPSQDNTSRELSAGHHHESSESYFNILTALSELNWQNLSTNLGFLFAVGYVSLFTLILIVVCILDRKHFRNKFNEQLQQAVHPATDSDARTNQSSILSGLHSHNNSNLCFSVSSNPVAIHPITNDSSTQKDRQEVILKNYKEGDLSIEISEGISFTPVNHKVKLPRTEPEKRRKSRFSTSIDSENKAILPKRKFSPVDKIKKRLNKILKDPKISKSCFCVFHKLAQNELSTNNQMYNLFARYNPLNRRTTRFMFCYSAILLEFIACALFCFLGHSTGQHQESSFQDEMLFNFLVALFSTILTIGPLLLLGCVCSFSARWMKRLKQADSPEQMKALYHTYLRRMNCRLAINVALFVIVTLMQLLFIICFCHLMSDTVEKEWFYSSLISIALDIVVFEIVAAFGFALCGVMKKYCRGCEGIVCLMVILEVYRIYRNLVLG